VLEFSVKVGLESIRSRAKVFHVHHPAILLVGVICARISNAKLVYDCHELAIAMPRDGQLKRRLIKFYEGILLRFVDIVIMSDGASRANAFRQAHHYDKPIEYIYNCPVEVNVPRDKKDVRDELEIDSTNPIVVYTGMVGLSRGLDVAISSMAYWPQDTHFVMIGTFNADYHNLLIQQAESQQVRHRVHFFGPVPPDDVALWAAGADVALVLIQNAGLSYYYSAPTKMFESIMAGVPQVSSNFPEFSRVILENGVGPVGTLVNPSDAPSIGKAVSELITNKSLQNCFRENANTLASTMYNWEKQERVLISMYQRILD
jgi:glycosyltransferase involved in cell wall biosynthesis